MSSPDRMLVVLGVALAACGSGYPTHAAKPARVSAAVDAGGTGRVDAMDARALDARDAGVASTSTSTSTPTFDAGAESPGPARPTRLVLQFTTVTLNGRYAPHNGGVAWVADAQGKWVHTFELWIGAFYSALRAYFGADGPPYAIPGFGVKPPPDVIASATRNSFGMHPTETWNLLDANGNEVPHGDYSIVIEIAESQTEAVYTIPFTKAGKPAEWRPPDTGNLKDVSFRLE